MLKSGNAGLKRSGKGNNMAAFRIVSVLGKGYEAPLERYEWSVAFMRSFTAKQMRDYVVLRKGRKG